MYSKIIESGTLFDLSIVYFALAIYKSTKTFNFTLFSSNEEKIENSAYKKNLYTYTIDGKVLNDLKIKKGILQAIC